MEGARRAAKHTQSQNDWWRGPGGQPNALRAGRSGRGGQEVSQTHSEPGGVVEGARRAAKRTQSREEWLGGQEGSQTHSEPGGVVEGSRRSSKRTQIREE